MRRMLKLSILMVGCAVSCSAFAQSNCLTSLPIDPAKSVTFLNFGPSPGDRIVRSMKCSEAENIRANLFVSGQAINPDLLGRASELRSKIAETRAALSAQKVALQTASSRVARETALKSVKIALAVAGAASATTACFTSGVTCIVVVSSAVTLYELVDSLGTTAGDLAQQASNARGEIDKIIPALQAIETQLNDNIAQQSRLRYNAVFDALCQAIKQQCL